MISSQVILRFLEKTVSCITKVYNFLCCIKSNSKIMEKKTVCIPRYSRSVISIQNIFIYISFAGFYFFPGKLTVCLGFPKLQSGSLSNFLRPP